ncbi:pyridoxamine 5'-phosphate oxidase family protein [Nocardioides zeae]|uniref:PPOX class F420-dependent oxidoreductase n=1 Tax=Nocardioides zeae TaxID=1457234 RepID=A0A6P0HIS8_9ACTN|nr:pyridoxamine 5'-phosphate oxidase family protein [Nocardioides zeae]NEN78137.1 PPOX class F420-dependent oxidoreductase [Nocardioides zeae]
MPRRAPTDAELRVLSRPTGLARMATVDADGLPHVVPTVWKHDPATGDLLLTGRSLAGTARARNVAAHPWAAAVIDGVGDGPGWHPWGVTLRGPARYDADAAAIRLTPTHVSSWGLD